MTKTEYLQLGFWETRRAKFMLFLFFFNQTQTPLLNFENVSHPIHRGECVQDHCGSVSRWWGDDGHKPRLGTALYDQIPGCTREMFSRDFRGYTQIHS